MWDGEYAWAMGLRKHPAMDRINALNSEWHVTWLSSWGGSHEDPLWKSLPREIYRKGMGDAWRRVGRYQPLEDGHGFPTDLEAVRGGAFLAINERDWFRDGDRLSPCARYELDATGELRFRFLVPLLADVALPTKKPEGGLASGSPWGVWTEELGWVQGLRHIAVYSGFGACVSLVDAASGRFLCHVRLPEVDAGRRYFSLKVYPALDGRFLITAAVAREGSEQPYTPGGKLAAARVGLIQDDIEVQPVAFRMEVPSGKLQAMPLPPGVPSIVSHAEYNFAFGFLANAQGSLDVFKRSMR